MKKAFSLLILAVLLPLAVAAQTVVEPLPGECWWGAVVNKGYVQPYTDFGAADNYYLDDPVPTVRAEGPFDLATMSAKATTAPFLVSNKGRYIWGNHPFAFQFKDGTLYLYSNYEKLEPVTAGSTLREAYLAGRWRDDQGRKFRGPKVLELKDVPLDRLPYYERIDCK